MPHLVHQEPHQSSAQGALYMLLASACFAAMGALVKQATATLDPWLVVFGRSLAIAGIAYIAARARGRAIRIVNRRAMAVRCVSGFAAMVCYFWALSLLPLATAVTIQYLAPVFVAMLSRRALGEPVGPVTWVCTLAAFAGVTLLVGPDANALGAGASLALASATLAAVAYLAVRALRSTDDPGSIVATFALASTAFAAPALFFVGAPQRLEEWALLGGVGLAAYGGQIFMTYAYRVARAAFVSALSYSTIALGAALGWLAFGERPGALELTGMALIVGAGAALSLFEGRQARTRA